MPTKHIHRIPVAEEFIIPIGEAVCICQRLDDGLHCIGRRLNPKFYSDNEGKPSGVLNRNLRVLVRKAIIDESLRFEILDLCDKAAAIFTERNSVVHSRGFTTSEGNQSRLYRRNTNEPYVYLDPTAINEFTERAAAVARLANALLHDRRMPSDYI